MDSSPETKIMEKVVALKTIDLEACGKNTKRSVRNEWAVMEMEMVHLVWGFCHTDICDFHPST